MSILTIETIADIHLGKIDPQVQSENLDRFIKHCEDTNPDIIVVCGDIMDHKELLKSPTSKVCTEFIHKLYNLKSYVIILEGTYTHDNKQVTQTFKHLQNDRFRIYDKCAFDYIGKLKFLIIPEEYNTDPKEYYREFLDVPKNTYDLCFGHGMFNHIGFVKKDKSNRFRKLTSPMWDYDEIFKKIVRGYTVFGHYHRHDVYKRFMYIGSYGRYEHGEEEPKGWVTIKYDIGKRKCVSYKHNTNKNALKFSTILESKLPEKYDDMVKFIKKKSNEVHSLRVRIDRVISPERRSDIFSIIQPLLNVQLDNYYERKKRKIINEVVIEEEETFNKYEGMDIIDATIEYALDKFNVKLTREFIEKSLNSD